jgi:hypothetical protein
LPLRVAWQYLAAPLALTGVAGQHQHVACGALHNAADGRQPVVAGTM